MKLFTRVVKIEPTPAQLREAVAGYLDSMPEEQAIKAMTRIMGSVGLTEGNVRRLVESVKGDRVIEIFFGNGDHAVISNRAPKGKDGPGW